jgi:hypothetical protein
MMPLQLLPYDGARRNAEVHQSYMSLAGEKHIRQAQLAMDKSDFGQRSKTLHDLVHD